MHIFIDESGIHKTTGYSSIAFIFVMTEFIEAFEKEILAIELRIKITSFHWADHNWGIRRKFLEHLFNRNILQNTNIQITLQKNPLHYYDFLSNSLEKIVIEKNIKKITLDGKKSISYERKMKSILRTKNISTHKLSVMRDQSSPLLRFADAIAGLTRFHIENPDHEECAKLFMMIRKYSKIYFLDHL
jgi:hypothetical protein